jgi:predicted ATPase
VDARRTNLPEPLTLFSGRERELVELKRLLPTTRLLTLIGIGGIGKTRLALQAASEVTDAYRDGVWFVDFAPLAAASLVPGAVAQALGVSETAGKEVVQALAGWIKGRQLLLLLDNCEHLLEACARIATILLHAAPETTIIATSREALHIPGEQVYPLPALSLPDAMASFESMTKSEAVQVYLRRAQRAAPDFELTAARSAAIAAVHPAGRHPLALNWRPPYPFPVDRTDQCSSG